MLTGRELDILYPYDKPVTVDKNKMIEITYKAAAMYRESLIKQIIEMTDEPDDHLRASLMGKAAIDILGRKFFPQLYSAPKHPRFMQLFHDGDVWEPDYYTWLASRGVEFVSSQGEGNYMGVPGHYDFVVRVGDKRVLLELKTANKGYFDSVRKQQNTEDVMRMYGTYRPYFAANMTDFRGHITQAALYRSYVECDEVVIVLKCKNTSQLLLYNVPDTTNQLNRIESIVRAWDNSETWTDVFSFVGIPEPRKELSNRKHTGRYLVPPKMYGSPVIPFIYEWASEGDKVVLAGYRVPEGARIPQPLFDSYSAIDVYTYKLDDLEELYQEWDDFNYDRQKPYGTDENEVD